MVFQFISRLIFFHLFLNGIHIVFLPKFLFLEKIFEFLACFSKLLYNFIFIINNFDWNVSDYSKLIDVIKESVRNIFFSSFRVSDFIKDSTKSFPPSTKLFGRLKCIFNEFLKLVFNLLSRWQISDIRVTVLRLNFDERFSLLLCCKDCFDSCKCS